MVEFSVEFTSDVQAHLNRLERELPRINRLILDAIGTRVVAKTQSEKLAGQVLNRQSGDLANLLFHRLMGDDTVLVSTDVPYGAIHEYGGEIVPKNGKFLKFNINGKTIFAKKVVMPKRPYLGPTIEEFFESGESNRLIETILGREFEKLPNP